MELEKTLSELVVGVNGLKVGILYDLRHALGILPP
jgi:hypothetical protein